MENNDDTLLLDEQEVEKQKKKKDIKKKRVYLKDENNKRISKKELNKRAMRTFVTNNQQALRDLNYDPDEIKLQSEKTFNMLRDKDVTGVQLKHGKLFVNLKNLRTIGILRKQRNDEKNKKVALAISQSTIDKKKVNEFLKKKTSFKKAEAKTYNLMDFFVKSEILD